MNDERLVPDERDDPKAPWQANWILHVLIALPAVLISAATLWTSIRTKGHVESQANEIQQVKDNQDQNHQLLKEVQQTVTKETSK